MMANIDVPTVARWAAVVALAGAVAFLEWGGHAPAGTFLTNVAMPGLTALGIHSAAKGLT